MRRRTKTAALAALALLVLASLVIAAGAVPIAASGGHWPVTAWLLRFTMRRSVATRSLAVPAPPDLDDPALVIRGAGHYEGYCRTCHGAPGARVPPVARAMTPHPPRLDRSAAELDDEELFYVIRHGVKLTAMPAWPADHRDDEVWSLVALVRRMPTLDAAGYRRLVSAARDAPAAGDAPAIVREACARCHGADGMGRGEAFPRLAGQRPAYLAASLEAYAEGERASGIMRPVAAELAPEDVRAAAAWYASRPPMSARPFAVDVPARGERVATEGLPQDRVPACVHCHGPGEGPRHPLYPLLEGQAPSYLVAQLRLFRDGHRGGTPFAHVMSTAAAHDLDEADMRAVAAFYARGELEAGE
ncbi:MAG: c-type cytochrome [Sandaracinaceae bacterium]|nr:c-type cytochrome [Sandaracinaceae bacterium]